MGFIKPDFWKHRDNKKIQLKYDSYPAKKVKVTTKATNLLIINKTE